MTAPGATAFRPLTLTEALNEFAKCGFVIAKSAKLFSVPKGASLLALKAFQGELFVIARQDGSSIEARLTSPTLTAEVAEFEGATHRIRFRARSREGRVANRHWFTLLECRHAATDARFMAALRDRRSIELASQRYYPL